MSSHNSSSNTKCWICGKEKGQPPERCNGHYTSVNWNEENQKLRTELQASQEECAALKRQVNDLRAGFGNLIIACNNPTANFGIDLQMAEDCLSQIDKQSLSAHDNEVIELCIDKIIEWDADETLTIFQLIQAIRNLKTEG